LNNIDISTSGKDKTSVFMSSVEVYNKEILDDEIRRLITVNVQLVIDKIETEKVKVNLEADRIRLFGEKNSLIVKKKELRAEIVVLNIAGPSNILVCRY